MKTYHRVPATISRTMSSKVTAVRDYQTRCSYCRVPYQWKIIARLEREGRYPSVAAMSGWGHEDTITTFIGKDWTSEVMQIANMIGHVLQPDARRDQGTAGKFNASHAEKQLIAYLTGMFSWSTKSKPLRMNTIRWRRNMPLWSFWLRLSRRRLSSSPMREDHFATLRSSCRLSC
jgi:hypothetical protein